MFVDRVTIHIASGNGGNGCVSFWRTRNFPKGGPDGGNGGPGGDIFATADPSLVTLLDFTYKRHFSAKNGGKGQALNKTGAKGDSVTIRVPCGTKILAADTGEQIADLVHPGQKVCLLAGGAGGRGNKSFAHSRNTTPRTCTPGQDGAAMRIVLDLYLIADIGIIGFPNAGKSSFLGVVSRARPKVAAYPFTTVHPHLGVMEYNYRQIVLADIPGLLEGAHKGTGLGNKFLKHIERTRVLLHMVDGAHSPEASAIIKRIQLLNQELEQWNPRLLRKQQILVVNKQDALSPDKRRELQQALSQALGEVFFISCHTKEGLGALQARLSKTISRLRQPDGAGR